MSLVVISHRMEDLARLVERMLVLSQVGWSGTHPFGSCCIGPDWLGDQG